MKTSLWTKALIGALVCSTTAYLVQSSEAETPKDKKYWNEWTYQKLAKMEKIGFEKGLATYIIDRCKETAKDPARCVTTASMIAKAESNCGKNAYKNNVFGINEWKAYATKESNVERWLKSYNRWWYNSPEPEHYYPPKGQVSKTRYCTDEVSSKSKVGCPFWLKHATSVYNEFKVASK